MVGRVEGGKDGNPIFHYKDLRQLPIFLSSNLPSIFFLSRFTFHVSRPQFPLITEDNLQLVMRLEVIGRVILLAHVSE